MGCFGAITACFQFGNNQTEDRQVKNTRKKWESKKTKKLEIEEFKKRNDGVGFIIPLDRPETAVTPRPDSRATIIKVRSCRSAARDRKKVEENRERIIMERKSILGNYNQRRDECVYRKNEIELEFIDKTRLKLIQKEAIEADATQRFIEGYVSRCATSMAPSPAPVSRTGSPAVTSSPGGDEAEKASLDASLGLLIVPEPLVN